MGRGSFSIAFGVCFLESGTFRGCFLLALYDTIIFFFSSSLLPSLFTPLTSVQTPCGRLGLYRPFRPTPEDDEEPHTHLP